MSRVWPAEVDEAARRCGVMRRSYAGGLYSASYIRSQLAGRRWQRPTSRVLVTHNGPLSREQELWVVLLECPAGSALAGLTAAELDGLKGFTDQMTVVIGDGARKPVLDGVKIWRSSHLTTADVHPTRQPRRTRLPRSLLDAAADSRRPSRARAIVLAGCQQRLVLPEHLAESLARRGPCRNRALILESIVDAAGGVDSLPERDFDLICRRRNLPPPTRQAVLRRPDGSYYLDRQWPEYGLACEIQGLPHMDLAQWDADLDRQNEIVILGPRLLFFTSFAVRHLAERVGDQVERGLIRGGLRH